MIKLTGVIKKMEQTQEVGKSEPKFRKRIFLLQEITDMYPNTWLVEFWQDDCKMGDSYNEGDFVTCYVDIKGKPFIKQDAKESAINSLKCWNVEKDGKTYKAIK